MAKVIGVVNYGAGNLFSVMRGLRAAGVQAEIVTDPASVGDFDGVVVPGVGAFGECMGRLVQSGMAEALVSYAASGRPLMGICLGMQLLMDASNEFGRHRGLGLIPGEVDRIPADAVRVPHVGWAALAQSGPWRRTPLSGIQPGDHFYFTHSFVAVPSAEAHVAARFRYGEVDMVAAVARDNVVGVQFHPELSSYPGLDILRRFGHE